MLFVRRFMVDEYLVLMNSKMLADVYDTSVGNVNKIRCVAARRLEAEVGRARRSPAITSKQEAEIVDCLLHCASEGKFFTKSELLNEVEERQGKILTYGWVNRFIARDRDAIANGKVYCRKTHDLKCSESSLSRDCLGLSGVSRSLGHQFPAAKLDQDANIPDEDY
jgi:hypothetical protein